MKKATMCFAWAICATILVYWLIIGMLRLDAYRENAGLAFLIFSFFPVGFGVTGAAIALDLFGDKDTK